MNNVKEKLDKCLESLKLKIDRPRQSIAPPLLTPRMNNKIHLSIVTRVKGRGTAAKEN